MGKLSDLVPCLYCRPVPDNDRQHCHVCADGNDPWPRQLPAAMAVELALGSRRALLAIRASYGLDHPIDGRIANQEIDWSMGVHIGWSRFG